MTDAEHQPEDGSRIRGMYVDIVLDDAEALPEYLDNLIGEKKLYESDKDSLPYPVNAAYLAYSREISDDIGLRSGLQFDALVINQLDIGQWQKFIKNKLIAFLSDIDIATYELAHQKFDFYIPINDKHCIQVAFNTSTHGCDISLQLEHMSEIIHASNANIELEEGVEHGFSNYESLHRFAQLWSLVLDTVIEELGYEGDRNSNELKSQIYLTSSDNVAHRSSLDRMPAHIGRHLLKLKELPPAPATMPEIEMVSSSENGFNTIGGLTAAKNRLKEVADIFSDPAAAKMYGVRTSNILLHGPPGTGKTSLARAFANEVGAELKTVSPSDIVDMWVGNSGKNITQLFEAAKEQPIDTRIVLFFDEFESLARAGSGGTSERQDVKKQLNLQLDDISRNHPNIIVLAATNADIDDIEPSLVRSGRIETIGAPAPNESERADVWAAVLTQSIMSFDDSNDILNEDTQSDTAVFVPYENDIDPTELAVKTDGMTGADFESILQRCRMKAFRTFRETGNRCKVAQADILQEIKQFGR